MHISLTAQEDMNIGGVVALVILTMVSLNFVRTVPWEVMFIRIRPMWFIRSKHTNSTKPTVILNVSMAASFWLRPTVVKLSPYWSGTAYYPYFHHTNNSNKKILTSFSDCSEDTIA